MVRWHLTRWQEDLVGNRALKDKLRGEYEATRQNVQSDSHVEP